MEIKEIKSKTILSKCGIPGIDYVINPYVGCKFGCKYCYASFMGRFLKDKEIKDWGNYVYVKINAPDLLIQELNKLKNNGKNKTIFLSSVTDPYQGMEAKYEITRKCLAIISDYGFLGEVQILTKSNLVVRDIDIFKNIHNIEVGLTVTSTDDKISRYFEVGAPNVEDRYKALHQLNQNGIKTYAFIGPLLPHFSADPKSIELILKRLIEVGTSRIYIEHLNLSGYIKNRLISEISELPQDIINKFYLSQNPGYREMINEIVYKLIEKYDFTLLTGDTIYHKEFQKQAEK